MSSAASRAAGRTLIFSMRGALECRSAAGLYAFEDLIADWMGAEIFAPHDRPLQLRRRLGAAAYRILHRRELAQSFASPVIAPRRLRQDCDFLFAALPTPAFTYKLADYGNLRERARVMACYISEIGARSLRDDPHQLGPLRQFDHLFVSSMNARAALEDMTGVPVHHLPFGTDAVEFSPAPFFPRRSIDMFYPGRRSAVTHEALMQAAAGKGYFYCFGETDTERGRTMRDARALRAQMAARARFMIVHPRSFDDRGRGGPSEIGPRFYEGAAAGAVILSPVPEGNETLRTQFDWPDAIIPVPRDAPDIVALIEDLSADPRRLRAARLANMTNALLRHDFVHRWERVLRIVGLSPTPAMEARKERLHALADDVAARLGEG